MRVAGGERGVDAPPWRRRPATADALLLYGDDVPMASLRTALSLSLLALVVLASVGCPPEDLPISISESALDSILDVCTDGGEATEGCSATPAVLEAFFGTASSLCLRQRCDDGACGGRDCDESTPAKEVHAAVRIAVVARPNEDEDPQPIALSRCVELGAQAGGALDAAAFSAEFSSAVDEALAGGVHYEDFEDLEEAYVLLGFFTWLEKTPSDGLLESRGCTADRMRVASELTRAGGSDSLDVACASCLSRQSVEFPSHCLDTLLADSTAKCFFDATAEVFDLCEPGGAWVTSADADDCEEVVE